MKLWGRRGDSATRDPGERRLGLALGGGAVRGAAHVGALSVLEREGIRPDVVAGTSVGAIVGAGIAAGLSSAEMRKHFDVAGWRSIARPSWGSKLSMLDSRPLEALLERVIEADTFDQLEIPFAAVASDILTGTPCVFRDGPLREALIASSAIPAIFEPVRQGDRLLVDGGLTNNLPIDVARELGATHVVALDIAPPLDGSFEPRDVRDMVLLSWNIIERVAGSDREAADLVITPDVVSVSLSDFSQAPVAYDAGVAAAEEALPRLRELLGG